MAHIPPFTFLYPYVCLYNSFTEGGEEGIQGNRAAALPWLAPARASMRSPRRLLGCLRARK